MFSLEKIKKQPMQKTVVGLEDRTRYTVGENSLAGTRSWCSRAETGLTVNVGDGGRFHGGHDLLRSDI